jgi:hypothetical protein
VHINRKRQSDHPTALDAQTSAQEAAPGRQREGRYGLQRVALACFGVLGTAGLLLLAGCPANLEQPERFDIASTGGGSGPTGGGTGMGGALPMVDTTCLTKVFTDVCTACHVPGGALSAGLDLQTAGVAARLVNVRAMHQMGDPGPCPTVNLVDTTAPANSWLLTKINGMQGPCGGAMPLAGAALTAEQKACVNTFVMAEAAAVGGAAAPASGAGAAAGGAAAATTAGTGGM